MARFFRLNLPQNPGLRIGPTCRTSDAVRTQADYEAALARMDELVGATPD
jgi:hypothetical protein